MERLTGDRMGLLPERIPPAVSQAWYNRLWEYEEAGLPPESIGKLREMATEILRFIDERRRLSVTAAGFSEVANYASQLHALKPYETLLRSIVDDF